MELLEAKNEENTVKRIEKTIDAVEDTFKNLTEVLEKARKDLREISDERKKLEREKKELEKEKAKQEQKIGVMSSEQKRLLEEYEKVKIELGKLSKIAHDREDSELSFDRIQALLSIYMILLEEIWQGQPHFRILYTLHGDKEKMTREELKMTTGIEGAMVLRAIQELAKVELVEYDIETQEVKLLKRLFPKKVINEE